MPGVVLCVLGVRLGAQGAPEDSARARTDTLPARDTTRRRVSKADSILLSYHPDTTRIRAPLLRGEAPPLLSVGPSYHWDREQLFASGALTLAELLARIPGVTAFSGGWISTPMAGSYFGDPARMRVFYDGVELDPLNPETHNVHDLATIDLWTLQEVGVERGANELRVYLRSWTVDHTTPYTRADVLTGNEETNLYRAFYGQRPRGGEAIQFAAQQFTDVARFGGGGSGTSLLGRLGWASGPWAVDAFADRYRRGRDPLSRVDLSGAPAGTGLPDFEGTWTNAYVRGGYGTPDHGLWAQVIAGSESFKNSSPKATATTISPTGTPTTATPADTVNSESQYVAAGGFSRWGIRVSGTERLRVYAGHGTTSSPSVRASFESGPLALQVFGEQNAPTAWPTTAVPGRYQLIPVSTEEATARLTPLPFISFLADVSRSTSTGAPDAPPTSLAMRAEAGVRLGQLWFAGGVVTRDTARVAGLALYDSTYAPAGVGRTTGLYGSIRGVLWRAISADIEGIDYGSDAPYRPKYQARGALTLQSEWLRRFPRHTFAIKLSGIVDYSTATPFPTTAGPTQFSTGAVVLSSLLEIRILRGTLTWQYRNMFGYPYNLVPGYVMPRQTNIYGIRWDFWN